jgi:nitrate reductase NapAB chaperone NapD
MKEQPFIVKSGLLVNTVPEKMDHVRQNISALKRAEVSYIVDDSRLVIVIHAGSMEEKNTILKEIEKIDAVVSFNLMYDHFEKGELCRRLQSREGRYVSYCITERLRSISMQAPDDVQWHGNYDHRSKLDIQGSGT